MPLVRTERPEGRKRNRPLKDYAGTRFGRLVAVRLLRRDARNDHRWLFRCDCGVEKDIGIKSATGGHTQSCGCMRSALLSERNSTHGLTRAHPREYRTWKDMRARCSNPNDSDYADYGGRGIAVCERWSDFSAFLADMGERPEGHTLDRIRVNEGYGPGNCRWATATAQANNKRSNVYLEMDGLTKTLQEWSDLYGVRRETVRYRLKVGMLLKDALTKPDLRSS